MSKLKLPIMLLLTVALLVVGGYGYYRARMRQTATLARIAALDKCLAASNQRRARAASNTVLSIADIVRKNRNQANDMAVLRQAQEIQDSTSRLTARIQRLRQSWQGAGRDTELEQLSAHATRYTAFLRGFVPETLPLTQPSPQLAAVGWLGEFDMAAEPKPAALALLTKLETQVRQMAAEALKHQAQRVGTGDYFDKMGAFVAPASEMVAPGAVYQAQLFLVQSATSGRMHFSVNGREVPIDPATGRAAVKFKVPAARPGQPDTLRAQWHGRVQLPWGATDTTLETTVPYFIVKPPHR